MDSYKENQIAAISRLLDHHEYGRALHLAEDLRSVYPKDKTVCSMFKDAKRLVHKTEIRMALTVVSVTVFMLAGFMVFLNSNTEQELALRKFQVNSLIEELGQVKDSSRMLQQHIDELERGVKKVPKTVNRKNETAKKVEPIPVIQAIQVPERLNLGGDVEADAARALQVALATPAKQTDGFDLLVLGINKKLTDSILLLSFNESRDAIVLTSIPRDLYVHGRKINEYYAYFGMDVMEDYVEEITGRSVDQYAVFDFGSFKKLINILGGVDVYVDKDIKDYKFPDSTSGGYKLYSVEKGSHHFKGEEALYFARSRKSTSDFDRSARQHKIVAAIFERFLNFDLLNNLDKAHDIYSTVMEGIDTDIGFFEMLSYWQKFSGYKMEGGNVLSTANFLYPDKSTGGQYILLPRTGSFNNIRAHIQETFSGVASSKE